MSARFGPVCLLSVGLAAVAAPGALAANATQRGQVEREPGAMRDAAASVDSERRALAAAFSAAYRRYPALPVGSLEAIAYARSRWRNVQPDPHDTQHGPPAYGPMGLFRGDGGFDDQAGIAAAALGLSPQRVMREPATNVLAAAYLLDRELQRLPGGAAKAGHEIEALVPALMNAAGFGAGRGDVHAYARASYAFDVLSALDKGVNDRGIRIPERPMRWERAFDTATLARSRQRKRGIGDGRDRRRAARHQVTRVCR